MKQELKAEDILKSYEIAKTRMSTWLSVLQRTYELCIPNSAKFNYRQMTPGQRTNLHVYDWTAPSAMPSFANNIVANLMPKGQNWCKFKPGRKQRMRQIPK